MTSQKLNNNTWTNAFLGIKSNFRYSIVEFILHMISAPLLLILLIVYQKQSEVYNAAYSLYLDNKLSFDQLPARPISIEIYAIIACIATFMAIVIGVLIALNNFSSLYNKSKVDMELSLPLTRRQKFASDFFGGVISYIGPFLIASIFSVIICAIGYAVIPDWSSTMDSGMPNMSIMVLLLELIFAGVFAMLMIYAITVFVATCCGNTFETIAYSILLQGLIPATILTAGYFMFGNLYGIDIDNSIYPILQKTSPIGALIGTLYDAETFYNFYFQWLIPFVLITALIIFISWLLYKNRKAEDVSKPFPYKAFYYVVITAITFCISCLFLNSGVSGSSEYIVPLIILSGIIYLIIELITNRGFKKFWQSIIRYCITIVCIIAVILLSEKTDGFGIVYQIPTENQISSATISYPGIMDNWGNDTIDVKDKEQIDTLTELHKIILDNHKNASDQTSPNSYYITLQYKLKSGAKVSREYEADADTLSILKNFELTDSFIDQRIQLLKSYLKDDLKRASNQIRAYTSIDYVYFNNPQTITLESEKQIDELCTAISADLKSLTVEQYFTPKQQYLGTINYGGTSIRFNADYMNTIRWLETNGIQLMKSDSNTDYNDIIVYRFPQPEDIYNSWYRSEYYGESMECSLSDIAAVIPYLQPQTLEKSQYCLSINGTMFSLGDDHGYLMTSIYNAAKLNNSATISKVGEYTEGNVYFENGDEGYFCGKDDLQIFLADHPDEKYKIVIFSDKNQ